MDYLIIGIVAAVASLLTFFSGFGLGTILTPAFILFFPVEIAVPMTGIVHLLNNLFKLGLVGRYINWRVVLRFGLPAIGGAFFGAWLLFSLSGQDTLFSYYLGDTLQEVKPVNVVLAFLMMGFALFDLVPALRKLQFGEKALIPGGVLSGFFGGLSGHQGALRSAFLIKLQLSKEMFIATGVVIACLVDFTRIGVYFQNLKGDALQDNWMIIAFATGCAFVGAFAGKQLLKKITIAVVQYTVAIMMIVLAIGLAAGIFDKT